MHSQAEGVGVDGCGCGCGWGVVSSHRVVDRPDVNCFKGLLCKGHVSVDRLFSYFKV